MTWQLRRATAADVDSIMQIETTTFTDDAWSTDVMAAEVSDPNGFYIVAVPNADPGRIDAYAGLRAPHGLPQADIQTIAVVESARRHGLGRVLMHQLIAEARQRGATEIFLEVRADNPNAQALYTSLGFEQISVRRRYYPGGIDAHIMRLVIPAPEVSVA